VNQVAIREPQQKLMLLDYMADRYSLRPEEFGKTVRATCGLATATPEQVAAFLIVAKEYNLNPLTKEIYAFPGKGGGVVPIVSIDGWVNLVNSHPKCDGFDFTVENDEEGHLFSITCTMHRKDRGHPTVVTEYLSECARATEPWKMKHRMLRHKSFIQAARYAFGFAGIYDEDEGRVIAESSEPAKERAPVPSPSEIEGPHGSDKYKPGDVVSTGAEVTDVEFIEAKADPISTGPLPAKAKGYTVPNIETEYDGWFSFALDKITHMEDGGEFETFFNEEVEAKAKAIFPSDMNDLAEAYGKRQEVLSKDQ
jgi:phage recombination protein Bet